MSSKEGLLRKLYNSTLDLLFPEEGVCFYCDKYYENVKEDHICIDCRDKLIFIENKCPTCGKPVYNGSTSNKCSYCINNTFYFTKAFSPLEFTGLLRDAVYRFKFKSKPYMYKSFGEFMVKSIEKENIGLIDLIVPVPLHRRRKAERGYNQSELLAKYISSKLDIPVDCKNLIKIKSTEPQTKLDRLERQKNMINAFEVKDKRVFENKRILLVDDIFTTGATVNECSKTLLGSGASEVVVITIATGRSSQ